MTTRIDKDEFNKTWGKLNELFLESGLTWLEFVGILELFKISVCECQKEESGEKRD